MCEFYNFNANTVRDRSKIKEDSTPVQFFPTLSVGAVVVIPLLIHYIQSSCILSKPFMRELIESLYQGPPSSVYLPGMSGVDSSVSSFSRSLNSHGDDTLMYSRTNNR